MNKKGKNIQLNKKWIHFLIWLVVILFFIFAPIIKDRITTTEGRPGQFPPVVLEHTDLIKYSVDVLDQININGQDVFRLWGWSFISNDTDQSNYDIYLLLQSHKREYYYQTEKFTRPDLQEAYPGVEIDLKNSGFITYISKESIGVGTYDIRIIYVKKGSGNAFYIETNKHIVKTPNNFKLELK